ncbi:hypothetical protein PMAYCL1PPCAC_28076, partial [Pristionchus mayeri]
SATFPIGRKMEEKSPFYSAISFIPITCSVLGLVTLYLQRQMRIRAERNRKQSVAAAKISEVVREREENIE